jgi:hypothetical protein
VYSNVIVIIFPAFTSVFQTKYRQYLRQVLARSSATFDTFVSQSFKKFSRDKKCFDNTIFYENHIFPDKFFL